MNIKILIAFVLSPFCLHAQDKAFLNLIYTTADFGYPENVSETEQHIDVFNFDAVRFSALSIFAMNKERKQRFKLDFLQDSLLNRIAICAMETFDKEKFIRSKKWKDERRSIKYALIREHSKHKAYSAYAFTIDLLNLKFAETFYVDKSGQSQTNLFLGNEPEIKDPMNTEYIEPTAVESLTERQFCERLINFLSKGNYRNDLLSKKFSRVGIAIKLDRSSINSNVRPRIFVILIFSGKQLQTLKIPAEMKNNTYSKIEE